VPRSLQQRARTHIEAITTWCSHWNDDPKPFIWHTSDEIIEKVQRGRAALNRQINSTTVDTELGVRLV